MKNGKIVPTDIKIKKNPLVGDIVKLRTYKNQTYLYKWHKDYPKTNFYGIVKGIHYGSSYSILYIQIIHPNKGRENWNTNDDCDKKRVNHWMYGKEDIEEVCTIDSLPDKVRRKVLACLV